MIQEMIPILHLSKLESGLYEARLTDCDTEISKPTLHSTIADAIRFVGGDVPDDFAHFVDVRYGCGSIGTMALTRLAQDPKAIADRLVALAAALYQSEEELEDRQALAVRSV